MSGVERDLMEHQQALNERFGGKMPPGEPEMAEIRDQCAWIYQRALQRGKERNGKADRWKGESTKATG